MEIIGALSKYLKDIRGSFRVYPLIAGGVFVSYLFLLVKGTPAEVGDLIRMLFDCNLEGVISIWSSIPTIYRDFHFSPFVGFRIL